MRFTMLTAAIAILGLTWSATPTWAAKGIKKNAGEEHVVEGVIVSVQTGNNGQGSFVLHHVHHKGQQGKNGNGQGAAGQAGKAGAAAQGAGQAGKGGRSGKGHTINVDQNTRFESGVAGGGGAAGKAGAAGKGALQASFANLKPGEHVTVHLKGKTAEVVKIHHRGKGQKKKA